MKILKHFLIFFVSIIFILFLIFEIMFYPAPFTTGKIMEEYVIKDTSKDTTFRYERYSDLVRIIREDNATGFGLPFTITAIGDVDNQTEIYLQIVGQTGGVYSYVLPKGKVDTVLKGELYEERAEIVFLHQKAKAGNLKLTFRLGSEVKNTL